MKVLILNNKVVGIAEDSYIGECLAIDAPIDFDVNKEYDYFNGEIKLSIPQKITPLQAKLQLLSMGLLDEVDEMVATDRKVQLYWEYALVIERNNNVLLTMAAQLGLTEEQLDNIFIKGSKL